MPNFIHGIDGAIVRMVLFYNTTNSHYFTVHDEFWIPYQEVFVFKDLINAVTKREFF